MTEEKKLKCSTCGREFIRCSHDSVLDKECQCGICSEKGRFEMYLKQFFEMGE